MKIAWIIGSKSDLEVVRPGLILLQEFGVETTLRVLSAHRTTYEALEFAAKAEEEGYELIIAAAGKAAHLPGVLASVTTLPVIGMPVQTSVMGGMDSLFSIVMMPKGVPVLSVGINAPENAALSACRILALKDEEIKRRYRAHVETMKTEVLAMDLEVQQNEGEKH